MGKIAEALRANLRDLAQADARFLRELDGVLPAASTPPPFVPEALPDGLERLTVRELKALCKQRALKGCGSLPKAALIERLRRSDSSAQATGITPSLPAPQPSPSAPPADLSRIEARLDRLEALLRRIALHQGVPEDGPLAPPPMPDRR
jgi:hypothetical protein